MNSRQRIRRVQRWLAAADCEGIPDAIWMHELLLKRHHDHECDESANCHICSAARLRGDRMEKACRLFAAELAWLCSFALESLAPEPAGRAVSVPKDVAFSCSFCGREAREVGQLVVGLNVSICGECARQAVDITTELAVAEGPIVSEPTCSGCMHWHRRSPIHGLCKLLVQHRANLDTCPQVNAPTRMRWVYKIDTGAWRLYRNSALLGAVVRYFEGFAYLCRGVGYGGQGSLHECARALVERVKGDR